jgi:uncharacterized protein (TIGR04168 family)
VSYGLGEVTGTVQTEPKVRIGIIGDLHGAFDAEDARYFNESPYDLLLFTGDIGSGTAQNGLLVARELARLKKPTLVVPGNNDAPFATEIAAEFKYHSRLAALIRASREEDLQDTGVSLAGYDLRTYTFRDYSFSVLIGRPYARGGSELYHAEGLAARYGVSSLEASERRLSELVHAAPTADVLWLAHNGPFGLGGNRNDIWGADFLKEGGDFGDTDLQMATALTKQKKRLLAVVAGHMHRSSLHAGRGGPRVSKVEQDGSIYVNPAVVPRIFSDERGVTRHHMALDLYGDDPPHVRDVWVRADG